MTLSQPSNALSAPGNPSALPTWLAWALLAIPPLILIGVTLHLREVMGPYWLWCNYDPPYAYLLTGLDMAQFRWAGFNDHPGVPLQALIAVVIWIKQALGQNLPMSQAALADPEPYLSAVNYALLGFMAAGLWVLGILARRGLRSIWLAWLAQAMPFFSLTVLKFMPRVGAESPLILTCMAAAALLLLPLRYPIETHPRRYAAAWGVVCAFGMVSKVTVLPILVMPLVVLPGYHLRKRFVFWLAGAYVVFILPIIGAFHHHVYWLLQLLIHTGRYGEGSLGLVSHNYLHNLMAMIQTEPGSSLALAAGMACLVLGGVAAGFRRLLSAGPGRLLLAVVSMQLLQLLMVAKHPDEHYLIPGICLAPITLVLVIVTLRDGPMPRLVSGWRAPAAAAALLAFLVWHQVPVIRAHAHNLKANTDNALALHALIKKRYDGCRRLQSYPVSSKVSGFLHLSTRYGRMYADRLKKLYHYDYWYLDRNSGAITHWGRPASARELFEGGACIVAQGWKLTNKRLPAPPGGRWVRLPQGGGEHAYVFKPAHGGVKGGTDNQGG